MSRVSAVVTEKGVPRFGSRYSSKHYYSRVSKC
jgi:hypothetical protein